MSLNTIINRQALENINTSFGRFVKDASIKNGTVVKADSWSLAGIKSIKVASGDYKGNIFRSAEQVTANNAIRAAFLKSVADIYGGEDHIPEKVKTAMKSADFDGKGRPLTARRIRATMDAIQKDIDLKMIADAVGTQNWCGDKVLGDLNRKSPEVAVALQQYQAKLTDDFFDIMKSTILPAVEKGKAPTYDDMYDFLTLLAEDDKPETKSIINRPELSLEAAEVSAIVDGFRRAALGKAFVRSEAMIKFFFSDSPKAAEMRRNYDEVFEDLDRVFQANLDSKGDAKMMRVACAKILDSLSSFMVAGMPKNEVLSLLTKMADEQACREEESDNGNITLAGTLDIIKVLPDAEQREVATRFMRQLGQSVLDGTIRPRKSDCNDALYLDALKTLAAEIESCEKNRAKNAKAGNHNAQPESIMGSVEVDAELLLRLKEINAESQRIRLAARA